MYGVLHYSHQFKWCDICYIFVAVTDTVFCTPCKLCSLSPNDLSIYLDIIRSPWRWRQPVNLQSNMVSKHGGLSLEIVMVSHWYF